MLGKYILEGHEPVACTDLITWAQWFETADRTVVRTIVNEAKRVGVSTVFLGLDHNFGEEGAPVLFESLVIGGALDGHMRRYCTWDEAEKGHAELCRECEQNILEGQPEPRLLNSGEEKKDGD